MIAHTIYLVQGHTGEGPDMASWTVAWRMTPEEAHALRDACQAHADAWQHARRGTPGTSEWDVVPHWSRDDHPLGVTFDAHRDAGPDPFLTVDYTGAEYRVIPVSDDPRAETVMLIAHPMSKGEILATMQASRLNWED